MLAVLEEPAVTTTTSVPRSAIFKPFNLLLPRDDQDEFQRCLQKVGCLVHHTRIEPGAFVYMVFADGDLCLVRANDPRKSEWDLVEDPTREDLFQAIGMTNKATPTQTKKRPR
jgi:hypothetical protein